MSVRNGENVPEDSKEERNKPTDMKKGEKGYVVCRHALLTNQKKV